MFNLSQRRTSPNPFAHYRGEAIVYRSIQPYRKGRVYFRGTWWSAKCRKNLCFEPNDIVTVVEVEDITLIVEPVPDLVSDWGNNVL